MSLRGKRLKKICLFASSAVLCSVLAGQRPMCAGEAPPVRSLVLSGENHDADGLIVEEDAGADSAAENSLLIDSEEFMSPVSAMDPSYQILFSGAYRLVPGYSLIHKYHIQRPKRNLQVLTWRLNRILASYDGSWSICIKDLTTNEQLLINDVPMPSASLMKLFIMGCIYDEIRFGRMERTSELVARITGMIRSSSNRDANELLLMLGGGDYSAAIQWLNQYIHNAGYSDATIVYNPFQETAPRLDEEHVNQTTAADCALLLERIYRRTFGTRNACEEAEALMLAQDTRYKIPSGLPETVQVGNKTGETNETEHDAAVIYTPFGDYILTILSSGWSDKSAAQSHFKELSSEVYAYFSDPSYVDRWFPFFLPRED